MVIGGKAAPVAAGQAVTTQPARGAGVARWFPPRLWWDGASIVGAIMAIWFLWSFRASPPGYDAYAYWAVDPWSPYQFDGTGDQFGAFRYSPAAAQLLALVNWLPWGAFFGLWYALLIGTLAWLTRWWVVAALALPPLLYDLHLGNIEVLLAAAIVVGIRYPAAWAFVLLTKVTPGVGLLWFVARGEWRKLATALGATAAIAAVSFVLAPGLWVEWPQAMLGVSSTHGGAGVYVIKMAAAAALVVWGARTDRPWLLIVAGAVSLPWVDAKWLAVLVGLLAFLPGGPNLGAAPAGRWSWRRARRTPAGHAPQR